MDRKTTDFSEIQYHADNQMHSIAKAWRTTWGYDVFIFVVQPNETQPIRWFKQGLKDCFEWTPEQGDLWAKDWQFTENKG